MVVDGVRPTQKQVCHLEQPFYLMECSRMSNCHDLLLYLWFHHTRFLSERNLRSGDLLQNINSWGVSSSFPPKNTTGLQMDFYRKHHGVGFSGPSRKFPASMKSAMSCLPKQNERIQRIRHPTLVGEESLTTKCHFRVM